MMLRIKRLNTFILQSFLPIFFMSFAICNFILVMQMLWRYIDYIAGKGIDLIVFAQFFWYAVLSLVPMSLPLAVLLASLMTIGNLGENLELLAIRSSGISLYKVMKPLIVFIVFVCIGAFFFQDRVMPVVKVKMVTLLSSFKQKSPEVSIPEGVFYKDIDGFTLYVKEKETKSGMLKDIMIYDFSNGYKKASVTVAKSGFMKFTKDKKHLIFTLYNGQSFSNLSNKQRVSAGIPYSREKFSKKEIIKDLNMNLNILDENNFKDFHFSKNTKELLETKDSLTVVLDSISTSIQKEAVQDSYFGREAKTNRKIASLDSISRVAGEKLSVVNTDSVIATKSATELIPIIEIAKSRIKEIKDDYEFKKIKNYRQYNDYIRSSIDLYQKFTLSLACLIFFFIGAPLGAIIRKGGIGISVIISVIFFIIYYIIDTTGLKMAREEVWNPFFGSFISTVILLPVGILLTYSAVRDSSFLNFDLYGAFIKKYFNPIKLLKKIKNKN